MSWQIICQGYTGTFSPHFHVEKQQKKLCAKKVERSHHEMKAWLIISTMAQFRKQHISPAIPLWNAQDVYVTYNM